MNQALGNVGATVFYTEPVEAQPTNHVESLRELARDMAANAVQLLIVIGANPVYSAPADLNFASLLVKSNFTVQLSPYDDETSVLCHWHGFVVSTPVVRATGFIYLGAPTNRRPGSGAAAKSRLSQYPGFYHPRRGVFRSVVRSRV